jgi:hypothetical protein
MTWTPTKDGFNPTVSDPAELLIQEARQKALRRRLGSAAITFVALLVVTLASTYGFAASRARQRPVLHTMPLPRHAPSIHAPQHTCG